MPAGYNTRVRIHRINYANDYSVGGAVITGTVAHEHVMGRVEANPEDQLLMQQGLETVRTFNALIVPGTLDVRERDELEITAPDYHPYYAARFRIVGVQFSSMDKYNPNAYMRLSMIREVRSHANQ